jgi:hypothetical protein
MVSTNSDGGHHPGASSPPPAGGLHITRTLNRPKEKSLAVRAFPELGQTPVLSGGVQVQAGVREFMQHVVAKDHTSALAFYNSLAREEGINPRGDWRRSTWSRTDKRPHLLIKMIKRVLRGKNDASQDQTNLLPCKRFFLSKRLMSRCPDQSYSDNRSFAAEIGSQPTEYALQSYDFCLLRLLIRFINVLSVSALHLSKSEPEPSMQCADQ